MADLIGQTIGNYQIEARLGVGGMGQVFQAQHIHLGRSVALKLIHENLALDAGFRERFRREARAIAALRHPNIVEVFDYDEQAGRAYMVMELISSGSLRSLLQRYPPGRERRIAPLVELIRQAAEGLAYAHSRGIIHRDIKPDNLLLAKDERGRLLVKVGDFGLARMSEGSAMTASGAVMGTPAYMSPEQCQGFELDARTDIYALGIVLYEATTGALPFQARTISEAAYKHVHTAPPPPNQFVPNFPPDLEQIILRCLAKAPEERYQTAADLAQALRAFLTQIPATATVMPNATPTATPVVDPAPAPAGLSLTPPVAPESGPAITPLPGGPSLTPPAGPSVTPPVSASRDLAALLGLGPSVPAATPGLSTVRDSESGRMGIQLEQTTLTLTPGQTLRLRVILLNQGANVDHFSLELEGIPAACEVTLPAPVQLYPGRQELAELVISVPRSPACRAGEYPVIVRARSRLNASDIRSAPGRWVVLPFSESQMALDPRRVAGRTHAIYGLLLTNAGNAPQTLALSGQDDEAALRYRFTPEQVTVAPGERQRVALTTSAPLVVLGSPRTRSFMVHARDAATQAAQQAPAEFVQQPLLPLWLPAILLGLLVALCLGVQQFGGIGALIAGAPTPTPAIPAPEITFEASATEIAPGQEVTLRWAVTNAERVEIDQFGDVDLTGSQTVKPLNPTNAYSLMVVGKNGKELRKVITIVVIDRTATAIALATATVTPVPSAIPTAPPAIITVVVPPTNTPPTAPTPTWTPTTTTDTTPTWTPVPLSLTNRVAFYNGAEILVGAIADDKSYTDGPAGATAIGEWSILTPIGDQHMLLYNRRDGHTKTLKFNRQGQASDLQDYGNFRPWTHIISVGNNLIFFYNGETGDTFVSKIERDGTYSEIGSRPRLDSGPIAWTHVVAVGDGYIMFYRASDGLGVVGRIDAGSNWSQLATYHFSPGWTHIVRFGQNGLFFYNSNDGQAAIGVVDARGNWTQLSNDNDRLNVGAGWTQVAGTDGGFILTYQARTGREAIGRIRDGDLLLDEGKTFSNNWQQIVGMR